MADLQWLKLSTNFFDNNKIKLLESERDGDTLIRVWIQFLTIAMKCNYQGRLSVTEDKPMTVDEFSKIMGKSKKKINKCLEKFEELKMIIIEDNFYKIKNWSKYQSADKLEEIRLQNCLRQQKYREKMKSEKEKINVTVTQRNTKEEKKIRNKIEKEVGAGVFNGEIGTILKVDEKEKLVEIKFDDEKIAWYEFSELDQIEHSYAITIHKAQRK